MSVRITAVICTHNRVSSLPRAIWSLVDQTLDKALYEIIVVDNASTDGTKKVIGNKFSKVNNLRYLYEPVLGLSKARNTGWQNAKGDYVAYIDDDAAASLNWLEKILEVFEKGDPKLGCVGGKIEPAWGASLPSWLSNDIMHYLGIVDFSDTPVILDGQKWLAGTNMAFPKRILEATGGFQVYIGRKGDKLLSCEETMLQKEIRKRGYYCFYYPEISVKHYVAAVRLNKSWVLRRMYWNGASVAADSIHSESYSVAKRLRIAIGMFLRILLSPKRIAILFISSDNPRLFTIKCYAVDTLGYIMGLSGLAK